MNRKTTVIVIACIAVLLCLTTVSCANTQNLDTQYVLYVGTNDKDTNQPVFTPNEAMEKAKGILINRFGGYTIQEAQGGWIDDNGTIYQEFTVVIHLSDTTADEVHAVCDEFIREFNQSTILVQENRTKTEYYSGNN